MARLENAEIASVESCNPRDVQPFRNCHDTTVDKIKLGVRILLPDIVDSFQVFLNNWHKIDKVMVEEIKEIQAIGISQVAPEQVAYFGQHEVWHKHRFGTIRSEFKCPLMLRFATVIKSDQETAVDDKSH